MHFIKQRAATTTSHPESHQQIENRKSKIVNGLIPICLIKGIILNIPGLNPPLQPNPQVSNKAHQLPPPPPRASRHRLACQPPPKSQPPRGPPCCSSLAAAPAPRLRAPSIGHTISLQSTICHCDHASSVRSNLHLIPPAFITSPLIFSKLTYSFFSYF